MNKKSPSNVGRGRKGSNIFNQFLFTVILLLLITFTHGQSQEQDDIPFVFVPDALQDLDATVFSSEINKIGNEKTTKLDDDVFYIGGNGTLFFQDPSDISSSVRTSVEWVPSQKEKDSCSNLPQGTKDNCQNYIGNIQPYNDTHMLLCGTMALSPKNQLLNIMDGTLAEGDAMNDIPFTALCSVNAADSKTSILASKGGPFSSIVSTTRRMRSKMSLVKTLKNNQVLQTIAGNDQLIEGDPDFVASFEAEDRQAKGDVAKKIYLVFTEKATEPGTNKRASRIAQVCANDIGGKHNNRGKWTSFLKVRLVCQTNEDAPFAFDIVQHLVVHDGILYGTFTTQSKAVRMSAVCAFRLSDVQNAFKSNRFWSLSDGEVSTYSYKVDDSMTGTLVDPPSMPGMCSYPGMMGVQDATSHDFPPAFVNSILEHPLVVDKIFPVNPWTIARSASSPVYGPLFYQKEEQFTQLAIEEVESLEGMKHKMLYVGTESGKVLKLAVLPQTGDNRKSPVLHLADYKVADDEIVSLHLSTQHKSLYLDTKANVVQIPRSNCEQYTCEFCDPCTMCLLAKDPLCVWNTASRVCTSSRTGNPADLLQSLTGDASQCSAFQDIEIQKKIPEFGSTVILGHSIKERPISATWYNGTVQLSKDSPLDYELTKDGRLEIPNFRSEDATTYTCEYRINDVLVGRQIISFSQSPIITPQPPTVLPTPKITDGTKPAPPVREPPTKPDETSAGGSLYPTSPGNTTPHPDDVTTTDVIIPTNQSLTANVATLGFIIVTVLILFLLAALLFVWCFKKKKRSKQYAPANDEESEIKTNGNNKSDVIEKLDLNNRNNSNYSRYKYKQDVRMSDKTKEPLLVDARPLATVQPMQHSTNLNDMECYSGKDEEENDSDSSPSPPLDMVDGMEPRPIAASPPRKMPQRTKSIPAQKVFITMGDEKLRWSTIRRGKEAGTYIFEVKLPTSNSGLEYLDIDMSSLTPQSQSVSSRSKLASPTSSETTPTNNDPASPTLTANVEAELHQRRLFGPSDRDHTASPSFGDTDSDSTLTNSRFQDDSFNGSRNSTPRLTPRDGDGVASPLLSSSYNSRLIRRPDSAKSNASTRSNNSTKAAKAVTLDWRQSMPPPSTASVVPTTTTAAPSLRLEPARADKSPTSTASSLSSTSSSADKYRTAPPSPLLRDRLSS